MIANLARLRETAVRHGVEYTMLELDPATVNALLDLAEAALEVYENASDSTTGWYQPDVAERLREPLSVFTFEEPQS